MKLRHLFGLVFVVLSLSLTGQAQAFAAPTINSNTDAFAIVNQLEALSAPPAQQINASILSSPFPYRPPITHFSSTGSGAFILRLVQFEGSRVSTPQCAIKLTNRLLNQSIDNQAVRDLAVQVEDCYRAAGFILNQVTESVEKINPKEGRLIFKIADGQLSSIQLMGDSPNAARQQLQRYLNQIQAMSPFDLKRAQYYLLLANEIPGLSVNGHLQADPTNPQAFILQVEVHREAMMGMLNISNRGTDDVGPKEFLAQVGANDVWGADNLRFTAGTTVPTASQLGFFGADYALQVGDAGTELNLSGLAAQTLPGGELRSLQFVANFDQIELGVTQPIVRSLEQSFNVLANVYEAINTGSLLSNITLFYDKVTALNLGFNYQTLILGGNSLVEGYVVQGLPINRNSPSTSSTLDAVQNFTHYNLTISHLRYLTEHFSTLLSVDAQYSSDILPVSEELGYGGSVFGLAYLPFELTGDKGVMGSASLRYDLPTFSVFQQLQPFISYDIGDLQTNPPTGGQGTSISGASLGLGINAALSGGFQLSLMMAKPLTSAPTDNENKTWAGFFNISWLF